MLDLFQFFAIAFLTWILWLSFALHRNYKLAKDTKLPIILSPVATLTIPWMLLHRLTPIISILHKLPTPLIRWSKYTYIGWQFNENYAIHNELGPAFIVCSPGLNELHIADHDAAHSVLTRRKEFTKHPMMYEPLNMFGRNLDAVEGEDWQRHRRLTAPNFNERVSSTVWSEAIRQAEQVMTVWMGQADGTRDVVDDTATLALHVLTSAGLGIQYEFKDANRKIPPGHRLAYRDTLLEILRNFTILTIIPMQYLTARFMPAKLRQLGEVCKEFKLYMAEIVEQEKRDAAKRTGEKSNLLSAMVRASQGADNHAENSIGKQGLTDDEIFGNLFVYNMAGHETTANTIATAVAYLALDPQWQDWLSQEVIQVLGAKTAHQTWSYEDAFPQLNRCLAVMYETLRLHGSIVFIPKTLGSESTYLDIAGQTHFVPAHTWVTINTHAIHTNPSTYKDSLTWKPDRWIKKLGDGREELFQPPQGSFLAWADGPRICPGKKFAQVEFVAVIASLFQQHRVSSSHKGNSSEEQQNKKRLRDMIDDSAITAITLQMNQPKAVSLIWSTVD